jgi:hypothetical protein
MTRIIIFVVAAVLALSLLVTTPVQTYAFKVWNVNLHRVVDLPAQTVVNRTTITDLGKCSYNQPETGNITNAFPNLKALGEAIQRENQKDKAMGVSDLTTILAIPPSQKSPYVWCGLEEPQQQNKTNHPQVNQANQSKTSQTNQMNKTIAGLNASNIEKVEEAQSRLINIAKLHNASTSELYSGYHLLLCVENIVKPISIPLYSSSSCEDDVTDMIVKHELGTNQTMIKTAYAFLKERGIQ